MFYELKKMTIGPAPSCCFCKRYRKNHTCKAFPDGIPDELYFNGFDHRKPFKGDHGIRFKQDEKKPEYL